MKRILAMSCCCVDVFPEKGIISAGGNALNVAANCSKTGKAEVSLMGNIGKDAYAEQVISKAAEYKINYDRLYKVAGETASNKIYLTKNGDRYFKDDSWTSGVWQDYRISADDEAFMKKFDAVATTFNDPDFKHMLDISRNSDYLLSVDFLDHTPDNAWRSYFDAIDLFFISAKEEQLSVLKEWSADFSTIFIATLGENGSVAYKDGAEYICTAVDVEKVIDTTGCGDAYQGAFIVNYLIIGDILSAMQAGSKAAAVTLSFAGAL